MPRVKTNGRLLLFGVLLFIALILCFIIAGWVAATYP